MAWCQNHRCVAIGYERKFMSVQEKFDLVVSLLNEHNVAIGEGKSGFVNIDDFISCVKAQGGTKEEYLKNLKYEDIENCLPLIKTPNGTIKSTILAKEIAKIFRGKEDSKIFSDKKADRMSPKELIESFDPEDFDSPIGKRLNSISRGERFIVYKNGRTIDVEQTFKLLQEIKQGFNGRLTVDVNGKVGVKVYKIGELPDNFADENPIFTNRPLRPDGTCDQTGRSWEGIPLNVRQFICLLSKSETINFEMAHNLIDIAVSTDAFNKLRGRYRKIAVEFDNLESLGNLPRLKITLSQFKNSPFKDGRQVVWEKDTQSNSYKAR